MIDKEWKERAKRVLLANPFDKALWDEALTELLYGSETHGLMLLDPLVNHISQRARGSNDENNG